MLQYGTSLVQRCFLGWLAGWPCESNRIESCLFQATSTTIGTQWRRVRECLRLTVRTV